ncbi:hypothetical protein [Lentzea jiangxiensis]|uniref:Uncharacterized protein n=1 Tax=Lentzea jiangxiensis TaxID=641025 RepID=A0A1H0PDK7_9PSEU|nr:hypothetical protein [Lentzea jiangxiensis]SDP02775.1 hypothetical protein SAMN05421507_1054 [Lentzea jiangxiensis]
MRDDGRFAATSTTSRAAVRRSFLSRNSLWPAVSVRPMPIGSTRAPTVPLRRSPSHAANTVSPLDMRLR